MKTKVKRYPLNQCALYCCSSKRKLAKLLNLDDIGTRRIECLVKYIQFSIPKKSSEGVREITAPNNELKKVQRRILSLLQSIERPQWLISGERGKCYIDNGLAHIKSNYLLAADIKSFYDNCQREYVYRFFSQRMKTTPDIAKILTDLVTYGKGIPTGCPTSQIIAYYAYENMFCEIARIAQYYGCIFTLYVDDMTFSSQIAFDPRKLTRAIDITLRRYGHRLSRRKVKYYAIDDAKPVTGTIITKNHRLVPPNALQKRIYSGFQAHKNAPNSQASVYEQAALKGRIQAARNIDSSIFPEIRRLIVTKTE